jgi:uncharacterized protein (TIGR02677 family)
MREKAQDSTVPDDEQLVIGVDDSRRAMAYLLARESDDYIAVMDVLEASVTDLRPAEVSAALRAQGRPLDQRTVETRLEKLRSWHGVTRRPDTSQVQRYADLLARNWRYTATPIGRQVQRFYVKVLAGVPTMREIPLPSLARVVEALETLVVLLNGQQGALAERPTRAVAEQAGRVFTSHDDLDSALVGAEDTLAGLADRFDLDDDATNELKRMLVSYATHVAAELDYGSARAYRALTTLAPFTEVLVEAALVSSDARALIERNALTASRGGATSDWVGLQAWFDPATGRAARFALRLVRALPGMHANLRRLHSSSGSATTRAKALTFARACLDPEYGTAIWQAVLGDHPWHKLAGVADEEELVRGATPWREGPTVELPELLRSTGRTGARGEARQPATTQRPERGSRPAGRLARPRTERRCARSSRRRSGLHGATPQPGPRWPR